MELIKLDNGYYYTYLYAGNNKNGNAIYSLNVFQEMNEHVVNITFQLACKNKIKVDKMGGIRKCCYRHEIENIVKNLLN